jgi:hypothetical protein
MLKAKTKLSLKKETLRSLNPSELASVAGGAQIVMRRSTARMICGEGGSVVGDEEGTPSMFEGGPTCNPTGPKLPQLPPISDDIFRPI